MLQLTGETLMSKAFVKLPSVEQLERAVAHHTRQGRLLRTLLRALRRNDRFETAAKQLATRVPEITRRQRGAQSSCPISKAADQ
jgi:hypothetical protein